MCDVVFVTVHDVAGSAFAELGVRWLSRAGYSVTCICRKTGDSPLEDVVPADLDYVVIGDVRGFGGRLWGQVQAVCQMLKARLLYPGACFYIYGTQVTPAAFFGLLGMDGKRIVYHNPDFLEPARYPIRCWFEKRVARKAQATIINEPNRGRFFASYYKLKSKPVVVPPNLPKQWPIPDFDPDVRNQLLQQVDGNADTVLLMHHGDYAEVRCSPVLLQALALLPSRYALVFTRVDKDGERFARCQRHARELGIENRIAYVEKCPYRELFRYTRVCDVGILLYPDDGIGNFY